MELNYVLYTTAETLLDLTGQPNNLALMHYENIKSNQYMFSLHFFSIVVFCLHYVSPFFTSF